LDTDSWDGGVAEAKLAIDGTIERDVKKVTPDLESALGSLPGSI